MTENTPFTDAELKAAKEALTHHTKARHTTGILGCTSFLQRLRRTARRAARRRREGLGS